VAAGVSTTTLLVTLGGGVKARRSTVKAARTSHSHWVINDSRP
jgi:hypothetical protein